MNFTRLIRPLSGSCFRPGLLGRWSSAQAGDYSKEYFEKLVQADKVVVFMKGTPDAPRCGFSNAVSKILQMHGLDSYSSHNVLEDEKLRQGIKEFSQWPTIPQVYFNGEFVGGCDIMVEMHQKGDLIDELKKLGHRSALLDQATTEDKPGNS